MLYPVTPTLSVEAFQDKLVEESVVPAAVNAVESRRSNAIRCYKSRTNTYQMHL
jgi:hypothetical protein